MKRIVMIILIIFFIVQLCLGDNILLPISQLEGVGYINENGEVLYWTDKEKYFTPFNFYEGLAVMRFSGKYKKLYGYINEEFKTVIEPQFNKALNFHEGRAKIQLDEKWGYIDMKGNIIIAPQFTDAENFSDGLASVVKKINGKTQWGVIDKNGKWILGPGDRPIWNFSEGLAPIQIPSNDHMLYKAGFINLKGELVIDYKYRYPYSFSEGYAAVGIEDMTNNFIDRNGNLAFSQVQKDQVRPFQEGMAPIKRNGLWGFMNLKGEVVVECKYIDYIDYNEGYAGVTATAGGREGWGFINEKGEIALPLIYGGVGQFNNNIAVVYVPEKDYKYNYFKAYINKKGEIIWDFRTDEQAIIKLHEKYLKISGSNP